MAYDDITFEVADGIAVLTLARPDTRNALSRNMQAEMIDALARAGGAPDVRVVVLTGTGPAFSGGGDFADMTPPADGSDEARQRWGTPYERRRYLRSLQRMVLAIRDCEKPVIAAVNGVAVGGGCDIALACDIRFAAASARFGEVFSRIGLFPGTGGTYLLPRTVGVAKALELIWTGDIIDAAEAERIGLVTGVTADEELMDTVLAFARRLAAAPPLALALSKSALYRGLDLDFASALEYAATAEAITLVSEDHQEGIRAFRERRAPVFRGL